MEGTEPGSSSGPSANNQVDDIVNKATGEDFMESAQVTPPAPPQVRYTRTGQVIPEGKVMMVNGGCVGEGDWKRSMYPLAYQLTCSGAGD